MNTRHCPHCGKKIYTGEQRCPNCREWTDSLPDGYADKPRLKKQNLLAAKLLSALLYPAMFASMFIFTLITVAIMDTDLSKKVPLLLFHLIVYGIFMAALYHVYTYLSNFALTFNFRFAVSWAAFSLTVPTILFLLSFLIENESISSKLAIASVLCFFAFFGLMISISRKIPETRGVFVEGIEDFSRLHLTPSGLSSNLIANFTNANFLYVAVATPVYIFRMFSKAKRYADKYGFKEN